MSTVGGSGERCKKFQVSSFKFGAVGLDHSLLGIHHRDTEILGADYADWTDGKKLMTENYEFAVNILRGSPLPKQDDIVNGYRPDTHRPPSPVFSYQLSVPLSTHHSVLSTRR